jgi:hypothetical protein
MKFHASWSPRGYTLEFPVITQTESNANEHWRTRHGRAKAQRAVTACALDMLPNAASRHRVRAIRFVRFAPGELDADNLPSATKHVLDQLVAWIAGDNTITGKGDDGPNCGLKFEFGQVRQAAYGVRVEMLFDGWV